MLDEFVSRFRLQELTVANFEYWVVSVRPVQTTLGATVIALKRSCSAFGEISVEEAAELGRVFRNVERVTAEFINHEKINYLALMMVDRQVHFHAIPRYSGTREFAGNAFPDRHWPGPPQELAKGIAENEVVLQVVQALKARFAAV